MLKSGEIIEGGTWEGFEVISTYSRAEALEDGFLIDVSAVAREARIKYPVALSRSVWDNYVRVPEGVQLQGEQGRLWDVLWMLFVEIGRSEGERLLNYTVFVRNDNKKPKPVQLKAVCGPGDDGEPVITILLPEED